jgi:hypothetical protein
VPLSAITRGGGAEGAAVVQATKVSKAAPNSIAVLNQRRESRAATRRTSGMWVLRVCIACRAMQVLSPSLTGSSSVEVFDVACLASIFRECV